MRLKDKKECGILMHIASLPSRDGIGTLGIEGYKFIDFLSASKQNLWQILPVVVLGEGDSPYKSTSCFAGEPLLIDLEFLVRDGLLKNEELYKDNTNENIDYEYVRKHKMPLLKKAAQRFDITSKDFKAFLKDNSDWIYDYSIFACISEVFECESFLEMPKALRFREPEALEEFRQKHHEAILLHQILQYFFYAQFFELRRYAEQKNIKLIGDIPIYVSPYSVEVWTCPQAFVLDSNLSPTTVAGVPPDIFSSDGQLWGNPIYDWEAQEKTDFAWWRKRLIFCSKLYDILRIDHFRAFESYYCIDAKSQNAKMGVWKKGPAMRFWKAIEKDIKNMKIIAEDLGGDTEDVKKFVSDSGFPNMKVLQFAFDTDLSNEFLPMNYNSNCVCYTGTHDNDTSLGWYKTATTHERLLFSRLVPREDLSAPLRLIAFAMGSEARYVIIPMQDWLELESPARMNTPGTASGNWRWRMKEDALNEPLRKTIIEISKRK